MGSGEATHLCWLSPAESTAPLVFSPSQRQFQLTAALSTHPAQHSWPSPRAGLSSHRRSPVTGQGAKSLFAKQPEQVHFLLTLPLRSSLRAHSRGELSVVRGGQWGKRSWRGLTLGRELGALRCQMRPLPSGLSLCRW